LLAALRIECPPHVLEIRKNYSITCSPEEEFIEVVTMSDTNGENQLRLPNTVEAMQDSEKRYRRLFESAQDGILILDADTGEVVDVNPFLLKLLGYSYGAICGQHIWELGVFKDIAASKDAFKILQDNEYIRYEDLPLETLDRRPIAVEFVSNVYLVDHRKVIQCNIRDITARKRADQRIRDLAAIVESSDDAIISKTLEGRILTWNKAAERIYGYTAEEIVGQSVSILVPHDQPDELQEILAKLKSGETVTHYETVRVRKDGERIHVSLAISPVKDAEARIVGAAIIARDITERARQTRAILLLNRLYSVLSRVSQAVVRATSPETFLERACREIVDGGGFLLAWIGQVELMTNAVVPTAFWGGIGEYVQGIAAYADSRPEGRGPTGACIREHHPIVYNDFLHDPQTLPWRDRAAPFGIAAAAAFPIEREGRIWGALTIYSDELDRFGGEDVKLLEKVAGDIGFALDNLDSEFRRKQAEDSLRKSEEQFRTLVESAPDAIFIQVGGRFAYLNDAAIRLYGAGSDKELLGHAIVERIHYDHRAKVLERIRIINEEEKPTPLIELKHVTLHGTTVYVESHAVPVTYQESKGALVFVRDITERKQTEESLLLSEERYTRLFANASLGIFRSTLEGKLVHVNPAFARMFGFDSPEEAKSLVNNVGVDLYDDPLRRIEIVRMILDAKGPVRTEELYKRKDGSIFTADLHVWAAQDTEGELLYFEGFVEDISESKRAEQEKEKLEAQLRQSQKLEAIGTLAGGIAHDFNNILQPIIGYTEMELNELSASNPMRGSLEQVLNASLRAKELIKQILAISRSSKEQQRIPIDISSVIREALKLLRSSLPSSIEMRQKIEPGVALADPTQIHQVLMNLCTNAAHAMDGRGILKVRLSPADLSKSDLADQPVIDLKPGPYLRLTVSDTGCGMDTETMERIFDPYFTTKEVGKGSGLGLAVVDGIVKRHEGAITVRSEPGEGTTFSVYIPMVDVQSEATTQVDDLLPRGSERILLVDDEPVLVEIGTIILKSLGYKVTSQTDSVNALEIFRSSPDEFDLVITDYTMPKMTGLDFASEVLRVRPDIPILLCTGFSEKITIGSGKELGMGLLMKPYGMRQISEEVRKILDAQKGR
jgi:PAS domain S-box-containing protein